MCDKIGCYRCYIFTCKMTCFPHSQMWNLAITYYKLNQNCTWAVDNHISKAKKVSVHSLHQKIEATVPIILQQDKKLWYIIVTKSRDRLTLHTVTLTRKGERSWMCASSFCDRRSFFFARAIAFKFKTFIYLLVL